MQDQWPWYMTVAAVREFMAIAGIEDDDDGAGAGGGPAWGRAERELGALCAQARLADVKTPPASGAEVYRTGRVLVGGRKTKLEFYVQPAPRQEGDKPQLVRVRDKGNPGPGSRRRR